MVQNTSPAPEQYHAWYYSEAAVWTRTTFLGVPCLKSVSDMWNYQEILSSLRPSLVVEFGTYSGGSALYFATICAAVSERFRVLSVDIDHNRVPDRVRHHQFIELVEGDSTSPLVKARIDELRRVLPGPAFCILDSDHAAVHVLAELEQLRLVTKPGDYVVVEDGNINGHPVLPGWGPGPAEALEQYVVRHPNDYEHDLERERKFGFTFAPGGFLIRK